MFINNESNPIGSEVIPAEIKQAAILAQQGELMAAEGLYHKLLQDTPEHPQALYGLAQLADLIDDQDVKETLLSQAIAQLMDNADPVQRSLAAAWLTELAEMLFKLNRAEEAMDCLGQCENLIAQNLKHPYDLLN